VRLRHFPDRPTLFEEDFSSYPDEPSLHEATFGDFVRIAARLQTEATREIRRLEAEIAIREARLAWERGDREEALAALHRARGWLPTHAPVHRVLGEYLLRADRVGEAAHAARRAAELEPHNSDFWHFLGIVLRRLGNLPAARTAQARALDLEPAHQAARTCLENLDAAIAAVEEAPPINRTA
jgi:Flp pilus assembly protein TadD